MEYSEQKEEEKIEESAMDIVKPKYEGVLLDEKGELVYTKRHQSLAYKILKYNPIDPLNDLYHWIVDKMHFSKEEGELQWWAAYIYVKFVTRTLWNFKVDNVYKTLFPEYGGGILVGNHRSHLDPFFFGGACQRRIRFMSKDENFKTPLVRTLFRNLGAFSLGERGNKEHVKRAWEEAKSIINNGGWVGIFPEGTRSKDGTLGEFKTGAVRLAIETQCPIVPMAVLGSENALPKGKLLMKPADVTVRVGKPIYYNDYDINSVTPQEILELTNELRQTVLDLIEYNTDVDREKAQELSIGSPQELQKKSNLRSPKGILKKIVNDFLWLWDDSWYSILKSLEVFNVNEHFQRFVYHLSGNIVDAFCNVMSPYRTIDYDKYIPPTQDSGAIICSNHNSEWDVIILATSFQQRGQIVYQQSKDSLFRIPVVNGWVRSCWAFPLKRGGHDVGSYNYALELLRKNKWIIIYPEGTTNTGGGDLLEGHTGPIRLAIEAKVPIYLVGITGTEEVYPKHAKMLNFGRGVILKAGPPFMEHKKYWDKPIPSYDELKRLTANMMDRIRDLLVYDVPNA